MNDTVEYTSTFSATHRLLTLFEQSKSVSDKIVDELPGIFAFIDLNGRIMRGNRNLARLIDIDEELLCEHDFSEIFQPASWTAFSLWLDQLRPGREYAEFQLDVDRPEKPVSYHWSVERARINRGLKEIYFFKIIGADISALHERGRKLNEIYSNLPIGLLTIGQDAKVESVLTERAGFLLGKSNLIDCKLADVLFDPEKAPINEKDLKGFQHLEKAFGNDQDYFNIVRGMFPKTILIPAGQATKTERHLGLTYQPVFKDGVLVRMLISFEDHTTVVRAQKEREKVKAQEDVNVRRILEVKRCQANLAPLIDKELEMFMTKIDEAAKRDVRSLLNLLHGLKGNSRLAGLAFLGDKTHALESELVAEQTSPTFDLKTFELRAKELIAEIGETRRLMAAVLNVHAKNPAKEASELLSRSLQKLFKKYNTLMSEEKNFGGSISADRVDWAIRSIDRTPLSEVRDIFANQLTAAAREVGKRVTLVWTSDASKIDQESRETLVEVLTHLGTNALAHGIEEPEVRKALGKSGAGTVHVKVYLESARLKVQFSDDGRGVDAIAIKLAALKKRIRTAEELNSMHSGELMQLIFAPGFSTAKEVTQLSGRGVGLDAVATAIKKLSGHIEVAANPNGGTEFSFNFKCPGIRPIRTEFITCKDFHSQLTEVVKFQRDQEGLPIQIKPLIEILGEKDKGLMLLDIKQTLSALSGIFGMLSSSGPVLVTTQLDALGEIRFRIEPGQGPQAAALPFEYEVLQDSFETWMKAHGSSVVEIDDGTILITLGHMVPDLQLPKITLVAQKDLVASEFLAIHSATKLVCQGLGIAVDPAAEGMDYGTSVVIHASSRIASAANRHTISVGDSMTKIKATVMDAMKTYLGI